MTFWLLGNWSGLIWAWVPRIPDPQTRDIYLFNLQILHGSSFQLHQCHRESSTLNLTISQKVFSKSLSPNLNASSTLSQCTAHCFRKMSQCWKICIFYTNIKKRLIGPQLTRTKEIPFEFVLIGLIVFLSSIFSIFYKLWTTSCLNLQP